jgi:hypothetical protein
VRFLNDQQDVLLWHLYLEPGGQERVLCSPYDLEEVAGWHDGAGPTADERAGVIANTVIVAPSFEAFVYRFWLENVLWFKLDKRAGDFSDEERAYLTHYERAGGAAH